MHALPNELMVFEQKDIYNMERAPDHKLAAKQLHGTKKSKSRLTACMCGNADRSDKCPI